MIGKLKGLVEVIGEGTIILDVNGVGYEVFLSAKALRSLSAGEIANIIIETHVREDAIRLYGFLSEIERSWFRLLQTVQGVGSKVALAILGVLSPQELSSAIALQDWAPLEQTPGVGKKLAQRIVAELKDKAPSLSIGVVAQSQRLKSSQAGDNAYEGQAAVDATSALAHLGYNPVQSSTAIAVALKELGTGADAAQLIRRGLKELSR